MSPAGQSKKIEAKELEGFACNTLLVTKPGLESQTPKAVFPSLSTQDTGAPTTHSLAILVHFVSLCKLLWDATCNNGYKNRWDV